MVKKLKIGLTVLAMLCCQMALGGGYPLYVATEKVKSGEYRVVVVNKGPVAVTVAPELAKDTNSKLTFEGRSAGGKVLEPGAKEIIGEVQADKPGDPMEFQVRLKWTYGRANERDRLSTQPTYILPFPNERSYDTKNTDGWAPEGRMDQFLLDILMPENTAVIAARAGVVTDVKGEVNGDRVEMGVQPTFNTHYEEMGNYVRVMHADGTLAEYMHLADKSVLVTVGQRVEAGTQLGSAGTSGDSKAPNLRLRILKLGMGFEEPTGLEPSFDLGAKGVRPATVGQPLGAFDDYTSSAVVKSKDPLEIRKPTAASEPKIGIYESLLAAGRKRPNVVLLIGMVAGVGLVGVVNAIRKRKQSKVEEEHKEPEQVKEEEIIAIDHSKLGAEALRPEGGRLMTDEETQLYHYLRLALPQGWIAFPKVSMNRLLPRPAWLRSNPDVFRAMRWEAVDFLLVHEETGSLMGAMDLEELRPEIEGIDELMAAKQRVLEEAGVKYLMVSIRSGPEALRLAIEKALPDMGTRRLRALARSVA